MADDSHARLAVAVEYLQRDVQELREARYVTKEQLDERLAPLYRVLGAVGVAALGLVARAVWEALTS